MRFTIKTQPYESSPVYDIRAMGHNITAAELTEEHGRFGTKKVFICETKDDSELNFLLRQVKGDVIIELPFGWDASATNLTQHDNGGNLPQVILVRGNEEVVIGHLVAAELALHFFQERQRYRAAS